VTSSLALALALLLLLLAIGAGSYFVARRLRARLPGSLPATRAEKHATAPSPKGPEPEAELPSVTRHPIVLVHGLLGFDVIALGNLRQEYFRGVRARLEQTGHRVNVVRVSPFASVRKRAEQLAQQLATIEGERVNIIAHSMGGIDARLAISRLGMHEKVASLTTIGTPHFGTPLADSTAALAAFNLPGKWIAALSSELGGFADLSTDRMLAFNAEVPDVPEVAYASYRGWLPKDGRVHQLLIPTFAILHRIVGDNDGIVPASSQAWGELLGDVAADHWGQIGWSNGFDVRSFYAELALVLARKGL
jgi:triacylglycerol lipase